MHGLKTLVWLGGIWLAIPKCVVFSIFFLVKFGMSQMVFLVETYYTCSFQSNIGMPHFV